MFEGLLRDQSTAHVHRVDVSPCGAVDWLKVVAAHAPSGFDQARDGVCIHRRGTVLYVGAALPRILGVDSGGVVGTALLDLFEPAERPRVAAVVGVATEGGPAAAAHATLGATRVHEAALELTALHAEDATPPVDVLYVCEAGGEERAVQGGGRGPDSHDGAGKAGQPRRATVLVCDDEARLGALTAGLLADFGFTSVTVASGEAALDALARAEPSVDVVLLDVNLSEGPTAHDVLSAMRSRGSTARVVLTSGLSEEDVDPELLTHPLVVGYVAKPYGVDQLVHSVRSAVARGHS